MRVLFLTQVLPYPPDSGPKVKTWHVLKYLSTRHDVTLVSFVRGDQRAAVDHLRRHLRAVYTAPMVRSPAHDALALVRSFLSGQPWMMLRDDRTAMRRLVDRLAEKEEFDIVHADQLNMAQYAHRVPGTSRVLDEHNALWLLYRRLAATMPVGPQKWLLERDWRLLKRYEGQMVRSFDAVLAVSNEDRAALLEAAGAKREIVVVPIAIDTVETRPLERVPGANHVLHLGTMFWPPNVDGVLWFIRHVWPLVRQRHPDATFDVVGSRPPPRLKALSGERVNVTGYVADPTPYLRRCGAFVVPLRAGGGMRVKILNAMAQGLPVVSTTLGAEGIAVTDKQNILLADAPADFAAAVSRLLDDRELATRLGTAGRRLIETRYDYRHACRPLDEVYAQAAQNRRAL